MPPLFSAITRCRACASSRLDGAFSLGSFALSDFLPPGSTFDTAPLDVVRCADCTLVQLRHTVDRERLYRRYHYRSGLQPAMVAALEDVVRDALDRVDMRDGDVWLDIGANDGTLLTAVRAHASDRIVRVAYEPCQEFWPGMQAHGVKVAGGFFPDMVQGKPAMLAQKATVITSIACFYDADDPGAWVDAIRENLAPDGLWINQLAYLPDTLATNNVGDFCHEHLTYWAIEPFVRLLEQHGLGLRDVSYNDVNGGSVRLVVGHGPSRVLVRDAVAAPDLCAFRDRIVRERNILRSRLQNARHNNDLVYGYAAATKFNTCLQWWGITPDLVPAIADRNPSKWGTVTPTGQQVISEEEARGDEPDFYLLGAFHFLDQFRDREADWLAHGGRFIVPFPDVHVVGGADACLPKEGAPSVVGAALSP